MPKPLLPSRCVPCAPGTPALDPETVAALLPSVPRWAHAEERLRAQYVFTDFIELMGFVNQLADLAEEQGHHPDFSVRWNTLDIALWTHDVGGLHTNDFVLARKIDALHDAFAEDAS